jgi:hypothetical protein
MKLTEIMEAKLNKIDLDGIRESVTSSYTEEEMGEFKDFEEFFDAVDVQNGFESDWKPKKWKPYFEAIYNEFKNGKLEF